MLQEIMRGINDIQQAVSGTGEPISDAQAHLIAAVDGAAGGAYPLLAAMARVAQLQQVVVKQAVAGVTLQGISPNYNTLLLLANLQTTDVAVVTGVNVQFNSDTGANYSHSRVYGLGDGAGPGDDGAVGGTYIPIFSTTGSTGLANAFSLGAAVIPNYTNPNFNKQLFSVSVRMDTALANNHILLLGGGWASTAPIKSMYIYGAAGNLAAKSVITLWGLK